MDKMSLIRTIVLGLALVNQVLTMNNLSPLPIEDEQVEMIVSTSWTVGASLWAWWKNNYISKKGLKQKEVIKHNGL